MSNKPKQFKRKHYNVIVTPKPKKSSWLQRLIDWIVDKQVQDKIQK